MKITTDNQGCTTRRRRRRRKTSNEWKFFYWQSKPVQAIHTVCKMIKKLDLILIYFVIINVIWLYLAVHRERESLSKEELIIRFRSHTNEKKKTAWICIIVVDSTNICIYIYLNRVYMHSKSLSSISLIADDTHTYVLQVTWKNKKSFSIILANSSRQSTSQIDVDCIKYGEEELVEGCCPNQRYESISERNFNVCRSVCRRNSRRRHL